ncbi:GIP [Symbiodinium sp. CCMP2592]|nr:GIP [Symbiodinium sp. CCMP2592]
MKFTQADWEQHVANNHVPYRRDCAVCVHGAGNGRRHHGVVHPDVYCMSADIAGPIRVKGKDPESRNHRPATFKYFLAVSYRFPRLKGVKEESDPSQTEGFDDAALLPGGTDDLADEAFPAAEGPPHEDYEDSLYEPSLAEEEEEAEGEGVEGPREFAAKVAEEHPWESARCELETPPDMARLVFAVPLHTNKGDSLEEEHTPPPRRVRGKRSAGVRLDDVFALDPPPPLPPPAEAPHPEGPVSPVEEESARVARLSLQDLEGLATELIEDDWDLDEALWVLAEVCRAAPQLQHKAGLYRHGGVVGVLGGTTDKPWLTELMNMVLSAVAPTAEYTSLWLSNSTVQPVHADHHNLQGSTNVVLPLKLPPNGGDLWIELKPGDLVSGPVEERVDGKGRRWLGTTHKLERGKPFFLDPTRRHATTPWKGERAVLVGYTVNTLGKELEHEFQSLEALGFPLPASVRLPLTEQQDVRRLDAFDCFEEEPLQETKARHPDGKTSELAIGTVLKGGGWKETQAVEAGTVELEVSWNLKHSPDQRRTQSEHALLACQPDTETQVEEEESLSEDSLPEQPVLWELWVPHPQTGEQLCVLRSDDSAYSETQAVGTGTVAQQDLQLSAFAVVGAASQTTDEEEDLSLPVSLDADLMLAVSIICIGISASLQCGSSSSGAFKASSPAERQGHPCCLRAPARRASYSAFEIKLRRPSRPRSLHVRRQQARSLLLQRPDAAPHKQLARVSRQVEHQRVTLQHPKGPSSTALRPVPRSPTTTGLLSFKCASSATGALQTTPSTAQGRNYSTLTGWISQCSSVAVSFSHTRCLESPRIVRAVGPAFAR